MKKEIPQEIERFSLIFRIQHIILFTTFLLLAFSGWALKYPEMEHSRFWVRIWGGAEMAGLIHRIAGVTMLADFIWHNLTMIYMLSRGRIKFDPMTTVVPMPTDAFDFVSNILYYLGLKNEPPPFRRYTYLQKFDYWAVYWGMTIIGTSGFILAFPVFSSAVFPNFTLGWIWPLMRIMHSDEALLAIVFILFIHFYNEHLKPGKFPMSWVWLTGKMSIEELKHHHALDYEYRFGKAEKHE
jgi:cytochrome b subunit of formate dehydrogenase